MSAPVDALRERIAEVVYLELCGPGDTEPMPVMVQHAERLTDALADAVRGERAAVWDEG